MSKDQLIRITGVKSLTGISKSYIYQLCQEDRFPKPVALISGGTSVAWVASEVQSWIDQRIAERDAGGAFNE